MLYISQVIVFILAIIGTLFKSTETDSEGESSRTKHGLPVLTTPGKVVMTLLTLSFSVSLLTTWQKAKWDEQQKNDALIREQKLNAQLEAVKQQNQGLRDGIGEIIKASGSLSEGQKKNLQQLNKLGLDRDLSEVEIFFRPSEEHWKQISQAYQETKRGRAISAQAFRLAAPKILTCGTTLAYCRRTSRQCTGWFSGLRVLWHSQIQPTS